MVVVRIDIGPARGYLTVSVVLYFVKERTSRGLEFLRVDPN